jgi:hypothetical protein
MLTTGIINSSLSREIRKFLWHDGNYNNKCFHLVNWNTFKAPKSRGGLGIINPTLMNVAMGKNILWRLILGRSAWWKKFILFKYLVEDRLHCLENPLEVLRGLQIWHLLKASLLLIQDILAWIPRNKKKIKVWQDSIMGNPPFSYDPLYLLLHN